MAKKSAARKKNEDEAVQEIFTGFNHALLSTIKIDIKHKNETQKKLTNSIKNNDVTICIGPAGTGKTLMAESMAGETGKPFVFVDPGAFNNMFFGVGVLKVKSLFRKLRKLALRYGGVVVFFDEADSLGNRGIATGGGSFNKSESSSAVFSTPCHGGTYLSNDSKSFLFLS